MRARTFGWVVVFSVTSASSAPASWLELSPFLGLRFGGGVFLEKIDTDVGQSPSLSFGAMVDVPLTSHWQVEFLFSHQQSSLKARTAGQDEKELDALVTDYFHGGIVYLVGPAGGTIRPFVVGTVGATRFRPDVRTAAGESKLSFGFGGGAKLQFSSHFGARVEFRGTMTPTDVTQTDWLCLYYTCGAETSRQVFWQGELLAGVVIAF